MTQFANGPLPPTRTPIRFVWFDVDGVLTDGRLHYMELPRGGVARMVSFWSQDGHGLAMLRAVGVEFGFCSGNDSRAVAARALKLGARACELGVQDKAARVRERALLWRIPLGATAYIGDDLNDVAAMEAVALAIAPANAQPAVRAVVGFLTRSPGGRGAVREACELVLRWNEGIAAAPAPDSAPLPRRAVARRRLPKQAGR